jgi:hypothetical protein
MSAASASLESWMAEFEQSRRSCHKREARSITTAEWFVESAEALVAYSIRTATIRLPSTRTSMAIGGRIAVPCTTSPRTSPPSDGPP